MMAPGSRLGVAVRNQTMRAMPGLARTRAGSSPWVKAKGDGPRLIGRIDVVGDQAPGSHSRRR